MRTKKIGRIGVLMGGPSSEREISLKSGKTVYQALKEQGLDVVALVIDGNSLRKVKQAKIDCAFIALHGGFGEDGTVQRLLESLSIAYTGSGVTASSLCLDKIASRKIFQQHGIAVPEYNILHRWFWKKELADLDLKFPLVVKPSNQGSSIGISIVRKKCDLPAAIKSAFKYDQTIIIERFIRGREITVGVLQEEPLPVVEILPKKRFFDFQAKYEKGKSEYIVPARLAQKDYQHAQSVGLLAHQVLGCRTFSRVDMILACSGPVVLEVNSIPGLTAISLLPMAAQAQGISFSQLCLKIVQSAVKAHKPKYNKESRDARL